MTLSPRSQEITPPRQTDPFLISPSVDPSRTTPFKPGHRRIPTVRSPPWQSGAPRLMIRGEINLQAIRSTPTVILHESTGDGDCSASDYSPTGTLAVDTRLISPPPPPRIVAEAQQLPTCTLAEHFFYTDRLLSFRVHTGVPDSDSDDTSGEGDVDEPTVTLSSSPPHLRKTASRAFPRFTQQAQQAQKDERERPAVRPAQDALLRGSPRPTSTFSTSPFANLHLRNDSSSTSGEYDVPNKLNKSSGRDSSVGLHKRSRSVVSFFSLFSPTPSPSTSSTSATSPWVPDGTVREETKEGNAAITTSSALDRGPKKHDKEKKAGRVRKVFGRLFR